MCLCLDDFPRSHREGLFTASAIKYRWKLTNRRLISIYFIVVSALKATCFGRLLDRPRGEEERGHPRVFEGALSTGVVPGVRELRAGPGRVGLALGRQCRRRTKRRARRKGPEPSVTKLPGSCPRRWVRSNDPSAALRGCLGR